MLLVLEVEFIPGAKSGIFPQWHVKKSLDIWEISIPNTFLRSMADFFATGTLSVYPMVL